jgi:WD40 repeat protein
VLQGHKGRVLAVAVTPNAHRAVSTDDRALRVWDLEKGKALRTLKGHSNRVQAVAVTPDGYRAVSASHDQTLRLWDLENGQILHVLQGHTGTERFAIACSRQTGER